MCIVAAAAVPLLSCSSDDSHPLRQSVFNRKSSPAAGVVVAVGNFAKRESILLEVSINGQTRTFVGNESADGTHAVFTGIPSGHYDGVSWVASCTNGEMTLFGNGTLDVT